LIYIYAGPFDAAMQAKATATMVASIGDVANAVTGAADQLMFMNSWLSRVMLRASSLRLTCVASL
jgi:hypothetical protein